MPKLLVHHIPVCPFSQRLKILMQLKGLPDAVGYDVVDVTRPRDPALLALARGATELPVMETERGVLRESLVILRYLEHRFAPPIARADPYERAVEDMLIALQGPFTARGYQFVMNQDAAQRDDCRAATLAEFARLDDFLRWQNPDGTFLFDAFGMAEAVFTPIFVRFHFLDYYEGFALPPELSRVERWRDACLAHPAAQQTSREEVIKCYYDYAKGAGNGVLLPGRSRSSFVFTPPWTDRPWPPPDKYGHAASDAELGLLRARPPAPLPAVPNPYITGRE
jgi:glutathione S-transferase